MFVSEHNVISCVVLYMINRGSYDHWLRKYPTDEPVTLTSWLDFAPHLPNSVLVVLRVLIAGCPQWWKPSSCVPQCYSDRVLISVLQNSSQIIADYLSKQAM